MPEKKKKRSKKVTINEKDLMFGFTPEKAKKGAKKKKKRR